MREWIEAAAFGLVLIAAMFDPRLRPRDSVPVEIVHTTDVAAAPAAAAPDDNRTARRRSSAMTLARSAGPDARL